MYIQIYILYTHTYIDTYIYIYTYTHIYIQYIFIYILDWQIISPMYLIFSLERYSMKNWLNFPHASCHNGRRWFSSKVDKTPLYSLHLASILALARLQSV